MWRSWRAIVLCVALVLCAGPFRQIAMTAADAVEVSVEAIESAMSARDKSGLVALLGEVRTSGFDHEVS